MSVDSGLDSSCNAESTAKICLNQQGAGQSVQQLAVGNGDVAWIDALISNNETLVMYATSLRGGPPQTLDEVENGNGAGSDSAGPYIGNLFGDGRILAYNVWNACGDMGLPCPAGVSLSNQALIGIAGASNTAPILTGAPSFALVGVGGNQMALEPVGQSGAVDIVDGGGYPMGTIAAVPADQPRAVALSATRIVVERKQTVDVYNPETGKIARTLPLTDPSALLVGATTSLAVFFDQHKHEILTLNLQDGLSFNVALPAAAKTGNNPTAVRVDQTGLFYSYNVPASPHQGRIVYEPLVALPARH